MSEPDLSLGTFSNLSEPDLSGAIQAPLEHFWSDAQPRIYVRVVPEFEPSPPYRERTHFSGGVNLSAIERNRKRLDDYELKRLTVSVGKFEGQEVMFCCPSAWETLKAAIEAQGSRAVEC